MKQYTKCKECGFIMEAPKVARVCPACGASAESFEPYEQRMSEKRVRALGLHVHPIAVHLPEAFSVTVVILTAALALLAEGALRAALIDATRVLAALLPLTVVLAFCAGLFDAKRRFKKVLTAILVRKMVTGALFFALSLAGAALALFTALDATTLLPFAAFELLSLLAGGLLGKWGSSLTNASLAGD